MFSKAAAISSVVSTVVFGSAAMFGQQTTVRLDLRSGWNSQ